MQRGATQRRHPNFSSPRGGPFNTHPPNHTPTRTRTTATSHNQPPPAPQVLALLAAGERRRRRGATAMNAASSRSHTLLRLEVASARRAGVGLEVGEAGEVRARVCKGISFGLMMHSGGREMCV
jgi:hypothetical protein